ncbi:MAG: hypothetical protein JXR48_11155 [Candidatus Delongbacteria bacterium]|nr:hypothetical protein [Candidatus Delongbacteria bacterium]
MEYGQKALSVNSNDTEFRLFLSRYASIYKDYSSVVLLLDVPEIKKQNDPDSFIKLAEAYEHLKNEQKAIEIYNNILVQFKGTSHAEKAQSYLDSLYKG